MNKIYFTVDQRTENEWTITLSLGAIYEGNQIAFVDDMKIRLQKYMPYDPERNMTGRDKTKPYPRESWDWPLGSKVFLTDEDGQAIIEMAMVGVAQTSV